MFEDIRHQLMKWFSQRRVQELNTHGILTFKVAKEIQNRIAFSARRFRYLQFIDILYEILSLEIIKKKIVRLNNKTCICNE